MRATVRGAARGTKTVQGPVDPPDSVIAEVAAALQRIDHASRWERTLAIGKLILESFFDGDEAKWRERRRNKSQSIRRLAARPDCPYAKSSLTEAVGIYLLCQKCPQLKRSDRLTPTHFAKVIALRSPTAENLIRTAEEQSWTVRQISAAAAEVRRNDGERRGRPRSSADQRAETWAKRAVAAARMMQREIGASASGGPSWGRLRELCDELEGCLAEVRALLESPENARTSMTVVKAASIDGDGVQCA